MSEIKFTEKEAIVLYAMVMGDKALGKENNTSYFVMAWLEKALGLKDTIDAVNVIIDESHTR